MFPPAGCRGCEQTRRAAGFASSRTSPWHSPSSAHHLQPCQETAPQLYPMAGTGTLLPLSSHQPGWPVLPLMCLWGTAWPHLSFLIAMGRNTSETPSLEAGRRAQPDAVLLLRCCLSLHLTGWAARSARSWGVPIHQLCLWRQEDPKALQMISIAIAQPCKRCSCLWGGAKQLLESPDHDNWKKKAGVK